MIVLRPEYGYRAYNLAPDLPTQIEADSPLWDEDPYVEYPDERDRDSDPDDPLGVYDWDRG